MSIFPSEVTSSSPHQRDLVGTDSLEEALIQSQLMPVYEIADPFLNTLNNRTNTTNVLVQVLDNASSICRFWQKRRGRWGKGGWMGFREELGSTWGGGRTLVSFLFGGG